MHYLANVHDGRRMEVEGTSPCWDGKKGYKRPYLPRIIIFFLTFSLALAAVVQNTQNILISLAYSGLESYHLRSKDICNPQVGLHIALPAAITSLYYHAMWLKSQLPCIWNSQCYLVVISRPVRFRWLTIGRVGHLQPLASSCCWGSFWWNQEGQGNPESYLPAIFLPIRSRIQQHELEVVLPLVGCVRLRYKAHTQLNLRFTIHEGDQG